MGLDYIHIEVKRVEKLNIDKAIEQAKRDTKDNKFPTIFHRKNNKNWLVTMELDDWIQLYNEYYSGQKLEGENQCKKHGKMLREKQGNCNVEESLKNDTKCMKKEI